ncbi:MAG: hypothetical protein K6G83_13475, partial [Lachnospiraceae bacterium]|nr:hypothetical protein [Lachnospiraceae bacterium]
EQELMGGVKEEDAEYATMMGAYATRPDVRTVFPKQYYQEFIMLPFEFIEIPTPLHYDEMLRKVFGNYMTPFRAGGTHDYPMYTQQEEIVMKEVGNIAWPLYQYQKEIQKDNKEESR